MVRSSSFSSQQQTSESAKVNLFACCLLISSLSFGYYCIIKTRNSGSTFLARVTGICASSCHSSCIPLVGWKCKKHNTKTTSSLDLTHAFTSVVAFSSKKKCSTISLSSFFSVGQVAAKMVIKTVSAFKK